jgi:hypothetical protein
MPYGNPGCKIQYEGLPYNTNRPSPEDKVGLVFHDSAQIGTGEDEFLWYLSHELEPKSFIHE